MTDEVCDVTFDIFDQYLCLSCSADVVDLSFDCSPINFNVETGMRGPEGPAGTVGVVGMSGVCGTKGEKGDQGVAGIPGPVGDRGGPGHPGDPGRQGMRGTEGPLGPVGPKGLRGTGIEFENAYDTEKIMRAERLGKAEIGELHLVKYDASGQRPLGDLFVWDNPTPPHDPAGADWHDVGHVQGPEGPPGPSGSAATVGPRGPEGPQGVPGHTGPQGLKGPQGGPGHDGPKGERGTSIEFENAYDTEVHMRADRPDPEIGEVHLVLYQADGTTLKGDLFVYDNPTPPHDAAGADWHDVGHVQGPEGPLGPPGHIGHDGGAGATGAPGHDGGRGLQGTAGIQGLVGPEGPRGATGTGINILRVFNTERLMRTATRGTAKLGDAHLTKDTGDLWIFENTQAIQKGMTHAQILAGADWHKIGHVRGPIGLTGPAGATGPAGTGAQGIQGVPGHIGPAGAKGDPGAIGHLGPAGDPLQIENNLTGTDVTKALGAPQGRVLDDKISSNFSKIYDNSFELSRAKGAITGNHNAIAANTSQIATNKITIAANKQLITTNASAIAINKTAIARHTTEIHTVDVLAKTNQSAIASNVTTINNNSHRIDQLSDGMHYVGNFKPTHGHEYPVPTGNHKNGSFWVIQGLGADTLYHMSGGDLAGVDLADRDIMLWEEHAVSGKHWHIIGEAFDSHMLWQPGANAGQIYNVGNRVGINTANPKEPFTAKGRALIGADIDVLKWSMNRSTTMVLCGGAYGSALSLAAKRATNCNTAINFGDLNSEAYSVIAHDTVKHMLEMGPSRRKSLYLAANGHIGFGVEPGAATYTFRGVTHFDGNVGIGTSAPSEKLDVAGNIKLDTNIRFTGSGGGNISPNTLDDQVLYFGGGSSYSKGAYINIYGNDFGGVGAGGNILLIPSSSGSVGIGTSAPSAKLHVKETTAHKPAIVVEPHEITTPGVVLKGNEGWHKNAGWWYIKHATGVVEVRIANEVATGIQLPSGYRPALSLTFPAYNGGSVSWVQVSTTGDITVEKLIAARNTFSFYADGN